MNKHISAVLSATLLLVTYSASAEEPRQAYGYQNPPPGYNQAPPPGYNQAPPSGYNQPRPGYNQAPGGYNQPPPDYYQGPSSYNRGAYGPPPGYYRGDRYRDAPPPRGYRNRNSWGRNFFGFPGGRDDGYDRGPWSMRTFTDPERFWDDMLETPDHLPTMPGGWNVPSVSVPNPVEVGREIGEQAPDMVDTVRDY